MTVQQIHSVNELLLVMKHFIDLSAKLLPFLNELQHKHKPTPKEVIDRERIIDVYENYSFDTATSESLLDSNILELIQDSFKKMTSCNNSRDYKKSQRNLVRFMLEYKRLNANWGYANANWSDSKSALISTFFIWNLYQNYFVFVTRDKVSI